MGRKKKDGYPYHKGSLDALIHAVKRSAPIDGRTKYGIAVTKLKEAVDTEPDQVSRALILSDISNYEIISRIALRQAMDEKAFGPTGKPSAALAIYLKFSAARRQALVTLRQLNRIRDARAGLNKDGATARGLCDIVVDELVALEDDDKQDQDQDQDPDQYNK